MKITRLLLFISMILAFSCCKKDPNSLTVINSESLHEKQVQIHFPVSPTAITDSIISVDSLQEESKINNELDEMYSLTQQLGQSKSDPLWAKLKQQWNDFNVTYFGSKRTLVDNAQNDSLKGKLSPKAAIRWAQLNVDLLKLSGEVRFGDALEILLYGTKEVAFPEKLLKSIIYTHVFDDIYINIIGSSSMEYQHTTGGTVKLTQDTNYPKGNDMILSIETNDIRFMNIYIRIPSWAINPKVSYGNIKYVAHPGEYSELSKKWQKGDEIIVSLKN